MHKRTKCCTQVLLPVVRILLIVLLATSCDLFRSNNTQHGGKPPQSSGASAPQPQGSTVDTTEKMAKAKDIVNIVTQLMAKDPFDQHQDQDQDQDRDSLVQKLREAGHAIALDDTKRILRIFNPPSELPWFASTNIRTICTTLVETDSAFVDTLCQASKDKDTTLRKAAVRALGDCYLSISDAAQRAEALKIMIQAVQDNDSFVYQAAIEALDPAFKTDRDHDSSVYRSALPAVILATKRQSRPWEYSSNIPQKAVNVLENILSSLCQKQSLDDDVVLAVVQALKDTEASVYQAIAKALKKFQSDNVAKILTKVYQDEDFQNFYSTAYAAVSHVLEVLYTIENNALKSLLDHPEATPTDQHGQVLEALRSFEFQHLVATIDASIQFLSMRTDRFIAEDTVLKGLQTTKENLVKFLHQVVQNEGQAWDDARLIAIEALKKLYTQSLESLPTDHQDNNNPNGVSTFLDSENAKNLQNIDHSIAVLQEVQANVTDEPAGQAAKQALQELQEIKEKFLMFLHNVSNNVDSAWNVVRPKAIQALANLGASDEKTLKTLQDIAEKDHEDPNVRQRAIQALMDLDARDKRTLGILHNIADKSDKNSPVLQKVCTAFQVLYNKSLKSLPEVKEGKFTWMQDYDQHEVLNFLDGEDFEHLATIGKSIQVLKLKMGPSPRFRLIDSSDRPLEQALAFLGNIKMQLQRFLRTMVHKDQTAWCNVRLIAIEAFSNPGISDVETLITLASIANNNQETSNVRQAAIKALKESYTQSLESLPKEHQDDNNANELSTFLDSENAKNLKNIDNSIAVLRKVQESPKDDAVGKEVAEALTSLQGIKTKFITFLDQMLAKDGVDCSLQYKVYQTLQELQPLDKIKPISWYNMCIKNPDAFINHAVINDLQQMEQTAKDAFVTFLAQQLTNNEESFDSQYKVYQTLQKLKATNAIPLAFLHTGISTARSDDQQSQLIISLQEFYTQDPFFKTLGLESDKEDHLEALVVENLGKITRLSSFIKILQKKTSPSSDWYVRKQASRVLPALKRLHEKSVLFLHKVITQHTNSEVCSEAIKILSKFYVIDDKAFVELLSSTRYHLPDEVKRIFESLYLNRFENINASLKVLQEVSNHQKGPSIGTSASETRTALKKSSDQCLRLLLQAIDSRIKIGIYPEVVEALIKFYTLDKDSLKKDSYPLEEVVELLSSKSFEHFETITGSIQALERAKNEKSYGQALSQSIANAVKRLKSNKKKVVTFLNRVVTQQDTGWKDVRQQASNALQKLGDIDILHKICKNNSLSLEVLLEAIKALEQFYAIDQQQLASEQREAVATVLQQLALKGLETIDSSLKVLQQITEDQTKGQEANSPDQSVQNATQESQKEGQSVSEAAQDGQRLQQAAKQACEKLTETKNNLVPWLNHVLNNQDGDSKNRLEAFLILAEFEPIGYEALAMVCKILQKDPSMQSKVSSIFENLNPRCVKSDIEVFKTLLERLKDSTFWAFKGVMVFLEQLYTKELKECKSMFKMYRKANKNCEIVTQILNHPSFEQLKTIGRCLRILQHSDWFRQKLATDSISTLEPIYQKIVAFLQEVIATASASNADNAETWDQCCRSAIQALRELGNIRLLHEAIQNKNNKVRQAAVQALGQFYAIDEALSKLLEEYKRTPNATIIASILDELAVQGLETIGGSLAVLENAISDVDIRVQADAQQALNGTKQKSLEFLRNVVSSNQDNSLREKAIKVLGKFGAAIDEKSATAVYTTAVATVVIPTIFNLTDQQKKEISLCTTAVEALGNLGTSRNSASFSLASATLQEVANGQDDSLKQAAEEALSEFEASHPKACSDIAQGSTLQYASAPQSVTSGQGQYQAQGL